MTYNRSGRRLALIAVTLLLLTFGASSAMADYLFNLSSPNQGGQSGAPATNIKNFTAPYVSVDINLVNSTTATATFTSLSANCPAQQGASTSDTCTYLMGDGGTVVLNVKGAFNGAITSFTPSGGSYTLANTPVAEDGFGFFNFGVNQGSATGTYSLPVDFNQALSQIVVTLSATGGNTWATAASVLTPNAKNAIAAARIFVSSSTCSNYTDPGNPSAGTVATGMCGAGYAADVVPEPRTISLSLALAGLMAGIVLFRKKIAIRQE